MIINTDYFVHFVIYWFIQLESTNSNEKSQGSQATKISKNAEHFCILYQNWNGLIDRHRKTSKTCSQNRINVCVVCDCVTYIVEYIF